MPTRRTEIDLTVEREAVGDDGVARRYRLTARLSVEPPDGPTPPEELRERFRALAEELDRSIPGGAIPVARVDRPLAELVETYRPRQRELLELLRDDHELTKGEFTQLRKYLDDRASGTPTEIPIVERPIAAAPISVDRAPTVPRPVPELLRLYQIESLKQAGAVRGRRQISYEEFMALKRHFAPSESSSASASGSSEPRP